MMRACSRWVEHDQSSERPSSRYALSSTVPMYDYSSRSMNSCMVLDPLGAQAIRQLGHLSGWGGEDVLG
jgi:hypothetical protein